MTMHRLLSTGLAAILFAQCAFGYAPEATVWLSRPSPRQTAPSLSDASATLNPPSVSVSFLAHLSRLGSVRETTAGLSPGTVFLIKDVHRNAEAQAAISAAIRRIAQDQREGVVLAVEGAFGPVNGSMGRGHAIDARRAAADYLLRHGRIPGSMHAALTSASPLRVVGIDDRRLYDANVDAFLRSTKHLPRFEDFVEEAARALPSGDLGEKARRLAGAARRYDDGATGIRHYVEALAGAVGPARMAKPDLDAVRRFLEACRYEETFDAPAFEAKRARLLRSLGERLSARQASALLKKAHAPDFHDELLSAASDAGLASEETRWLAGHIRYLKLADSIEGESFFESLSRLEDEAFAAPAFHAREKAYFARLRAARLLSKLARFSLTPHDWRRLESLLARRAPSAEPGAPMVEFYRLARARDDAMAGNTLRAMASAKATTAILVAGGFHAPGLERRLADAGHRVVVFTPRVSVAERQDGVDVLSVFAQSQTPIERLFEQDRLFLAERAFTRAQFGWFSTLLRAVSTGAPSRPADGETGVSAIPLARSAGRVLLLVAGGVFSMGLMAVVLKTGAAGIEIASVAAWVPSGLNLALSAGLGAILVFASIAGVIGAVEATAAPPDLPDALLLELESLPTVAYPDEFGGTGRIVTAEIRALVRRYLKAGVAVGIITTGYDDHTRPDDRDEGLRPSFVEPFIADLEDEPGELEPWLSNLRFYAANAIEYRLVENPAVRPPTMPRVSIRKIRGHQNDFVNAPAVYRGLQDILRELGVRLTDRHISYGFNRFELNLAEPLSPEQARRLKTWLQSVAPDGDGDIAYESPTRVILRSSSEKIAVRWFARFAGTKAGGVLRRVEIIDRGLLRHLNVSNLGAVGADTIRRFLTSPPPRAAAPGHRVKWRRSTTRPYFESAKLLIDAITHAHGRRRDGAIGLDIWPEALATRFEPQLREEMRNAYNGRPPRLIVAELNESLTKRAEPASPEMLDSILDFLAVSPDHAFAVVSSAAFDRNPGDQVPPFGIYRQFLDPLLARARERHQTELLGRIWSYAEGGAVKLRYANGTFEVVERVPLPAGTAETLRKKIARWKNSRRRSDRHLSLNQLKVTGTTATPYSLSIWVELAENAAVPLSAYAASLQAFLGDNVRVTAGGHDRLVVNLSDKEMANRDIRAELLELSPATLENRTFYLSAFAKPEPSMDIKDGFMVSQREMVTLADQRSEAPIAPLLLGPGSVSGVLRTILGLPHDDPSPPLERTPPAPEPPTRTPVFAPGANAALPGSRGAFHATDDLQWLFRDPPHTLYLFSGGGGGDIKSVAFLAAMLDDMFDRHMSTVEGANFRAPKIVIVDSTVKHKLEHTYGGPVSISNLFHRRSDDGDRVALEPFEIGGRTARHFFKARRDMFVGYNLADENKEPLAGLDFEFSWTVSQALDEIEKRGIELAIMNSEASAEELAEDLQGLSEPEQGPIAAIFGDVGGDILGRHRSLHQIPSNGGPPHDHLDDVEHRESWVASGVSDLHSVLFASALEKKGVRSSVWLIGAGMDGELYLNLPRYLKRLLDRGSITGVWDLVGYALNLSPGGASALDTVRWARGLPISTESSNRFLDILERAIEQADDLFGGLDPETREAWRQALSPDFAKVPVIPLRSGTRPGFGVRATAAVIALAVSDLLADTYGPVPVRDGDGRIVRYESLLDHEPTKKGWWGLDELIQGAGGITESNERDHRGNSIRRTFNFLLSSFRGKADGEQDGGRWRVRGPAGFEPERFLVDENVREHYLHHPSAVVRLAALAALGPDHWDTSEARIWRIIEGTNNAFLIGIALTALGVAGEGKRSAQWHRILAMEQDVHHLVTWEEDPLARGLEGAFIQDGARQALKALEKPDLAGEEAEPTPAGHEPTVAAPATRRAGVVHGVRPRTTWAVLFSALWASFGAAPAPSSAGASAHRVFMERAIAQAWESRRERGVLSARIGAVLADESGGSGAGFNLARSLLHAEHFAILDYLEHRLRAFNDEPSRSLLNELAQLRRDAEAPLLEPVYTDFLENTAQRLAEIAKTVKARRGLPEESLTLYVSMEPCGRCAMLIAAVGIRRVVVITDKPNGGGAQQLAESGVDLIWMQDPDLMAQSRAAQPGYLFLAAKFPWLQSFLQWLGRWASVLFQWTRGVANGHCFLPIVLGLAMAGTAEAKPVAADGPKPLVGVSFIDGRRSPADAEIDRHTRRATAETALDDVKPQDPLDDAMRSLRALRAIRASS